MDRLRSRRAPCYSPLPPPGISPVSRDVSVQQGDEDPTLLFFPLPLLLCRPPGCTTTGVSTTCGTWVLQKSFASSSFVLPPSHKDTAGCPDGGKVLAFLRSLFSLFPPFPPMFIYSVVLVKRMRESSRAGMAWSLFLPLFLFLPLRSFVLAVCQLRLHVPDADAPFFWAPPCGNHDGSSPRPSVPSPPFTTTSLSSLPQRRTTPGRPCCFPFPFLSSSFLCGNVRPPPMPGGSRLPPALFFPPFPFLPLFMP